MKLSMSSSPILPLSTNHLALQPTNFLSHPSRRPQVFLYPYPTKNTFKSIMSAPNAGRQSPDPETQTGAQQQDVPASKPNDQGVASSDSAPKEDSQNQLKGLESNPRHVLQDSADEKIKKTVS